MSQGGFQEPQGEPWESCMDFTQFVGCLRHQMTEGINIGKIYRALSDRKWRDFFAPKAIEVCRNMNMPSAIREAVAKDSPAMLEIALTMQGKKPCKGMIHYIWGNSFKAVRTFVATIPWGGKVHVIWANSFKVVGNAILMHLLEHHPKALCAAISRENLLSLLCSAVWRVTIGKEEFSTCPNLFCWLNRNCLREVELLKGVEEIFDCAFTDCTGLSKIVIPDTVKRIGTYAFRMCALTSIELPDSVTEIASHAFAGCGNLTSVIIPDSVTKIGEGAFEGCGNLTSVVLPEGVTEIASHAFAGCENLTSVIIPDSVKKIGGSVFFGCPSLTGSVKSITKENNHE